MNEGNTPEYYMRQALALAAEALELGEFPIAAIVVVDDRIIARATASEQREKCFLGCAERCITFHNEQPGDVSFPKWIDPAWHNCLVGCLLCQKVCPQNKEFVNWVEDGAQFSEEETVLILEGVPFDQLPADTSAKWKHLGLDEDYDIYPRNLKVLLDR